MGVLLSDPPDFEGEIGYQRTLVGRGPKQELAFRIKQLLQRFAADKSKSVLKYDSREALNALCRDLQRNAESMEAKDDER